MCIRPPGSLMLKLWTCPFLTSTSRPRLPCIVTFWLDCCTWSVMMIFSLLVAAVRGSVPDASRLIGGVRRLGPVIGVRRSQARVPVSEQVDRVLARGPEQAADLHVRKAA